MQDIVENREIANVDLSKIAALQQKRTLAFVNHFVVTTIQFLNNFAKKCEQKLLHFERKLEKINASMVLIEARLSSIPEVNNPEKNVKQEINKNDLDIVEKQHDVHNITMEQNVDIEQSNEVETINQRTEFEKFIKMVHVGVPLDAVKLKISLEGLDPNKFDKVMQKKL